MKMTMTEAEKYQALRQLVKLTDVTGQGKMSALRHGMEEVLTPRQKQLVHMYYIEQKPMQLIAEELSYASPAEDEYALARNAVRRRLHEQRHRSLGGYRRIADDEVGQQHTVVQAYAEHFRRLTHFRTHLAAADERTLRQLGKEPCRLRR